MILKNLRVNGEFYVAPVFNQLLEEGRRLAFWNIGQVLSGMYGLGTPDDLSRFMELSKIGRAHV